MPREPRPQRDFRLRRSFTTQQDQQTRVLETGHAIAMQIDLSVGKRERFLVTTRGRQRTRTNPGQIIVRLDGQRFGQCIGGSLRVVGIGLPQPTQAQCTGRGGIGRAQQVRDLSRAIDIVGLREQRLERGEGSLRATVIHGQRGFEKIGGRANLMEFQSGEAGEVKRLGRCRIPADPAPRGAQRQRRLLRIGGQMGGAREHANIRGGGGDGGILSCRQRQLVSSGGDFSDNERRNRCLRIGWRV